MPTEKEVLIVQKATIYDLRKLIENSNLTDEAKESIYDLMDAYIEGSEA